MGKKRRKKIPETFRAYAKHKNELTIINDIIFKGTFIVISHTLRKEVINKVHYSNLGVQKCKILVRESIFLPGMDNQI